MGTPEERRYAHTCEACTFLGTHEEYDLYFCEQNRIMPTVIARYGDDFDAYNSGLALADFAPELRVALVRAMQKGLI